MRQLICTFIGSLMRLNYGQEKNVIKSTAISTDTQRDKKKMKKDSVLGIIGTSPANLYSSSPHT